MSRKKKTQEELEREAEAADARTSEIAKQRSECPHWDCSVTEWWFSGKPRNVECNDCGELNWIEER